jgi:hypothetical protein
VAEKITEIYHDGWRIVSTFDKQGLLTNECNYYKNELRSNCRYDYNFSDTMLVIKKEERGVNIDLQILQYSYDSLGFCKLFKSYYNGRDNHYSDNFIYENGLLISYTDANYWQKMNNKPSLTVLDYNRNNQMILKKEIHNEGDTTFNTYLYNQTGLLTDYIKENNSIETVYSGVPAWSNERMNKIHIRYVDFDKHGNWTKSLFITKAGKKLRSIRQIEYPKQNRDRQ